MGFRLAAWLAVCATACALGAWAAHRDRLRAEEGAVAFAAAVPGCPIVIPADATKGEEGAAETLRRTLARAAGRGPENFPVLRERGGMPRRAIWIGETRRGGHHLPAERRQPYDSGVGWHVEAGSIFVKGERRESAEAAVGWFLEQTLGAQWYLPGPLGEHVPRRAELILKRESRREWPGFLHRDLGLTGDPETAQWYGRNRLQARFEHGHNLANIFRAEDLQRNPEMAPVRNGRKFFPAATSANWQPNFLSEDAVRHAAAAATAAFDRDPARLSFSLSVNDTALYDESEATLAAVSPPRFFRHRPDYSPLVFGFANAVANLVAQRHPDRWLPAYAYYWCENAPAFPVARNLVPFLTADRSQWSYPEFAREDQDLIQRWCRSGAEIVGVYDYFYGAPHWAPRPTLYAVKQSIPFHHRAGVRAFYAETYSNWALDGPKAWLAAQLLWSPQRDPEQLLDQYFREFWAEAAGPMRSFYAVAERTWLEQPGPPLWLRFYEDENQSWIYPAARREELRAHLRDASRAAAQEVVRARVAFVQLAFSVTEAFWRFTAARENAGRLASGGGDPTTLFAAWRTYREDREAFARSYADVRRQQPLALAPQKLALYLRNRPDGRIVRELLRSPEGRRLLTDNPHDTWLNFGASADELLRLPRDGIETLEDPGWGQVQLRSVGSSATSSWTEPGSAWLGSGEAWEGRSIAMTAPPAEKPQLRVSGCRTESFGQWRPATPQALYAATVKVRAQTSPGTATFLIVSFLDENGKHVDMGHVDRLPPSEGKQETTLCVIVRAPPHARHVGFAVRVLNQINDDFAEFADASLRRLNSPRAAPPE